MDFFRHVATWALRFGTTSAASSALRQKKTEGTCFARNDAAFHAAARTSSLVALGTLAVASVAMAQTAPAPAPEPAAPSAWSAGPINFSGLIDGYYSFNFQHPASRNNVLRNFDVRANQMSLNMAKLTLDHDPDPVGFKLDFGFGRAMEIFHATDPAGTDVVRYIPQAYLSVKPKNAGGLQIDFGKFYTSAGAELTETHLAWNYSRGFLYANGPYYHMGARITKPLTKNFSAGVQLVNGWNNVEDNNTGKTLGFTTALTTSKVSWYNTYYTGPEKNNNNKGWRNFYDTVVNINPNDKVSTYFNFDYGVDRNPGATNSDWIAFGMAARFAANSKFSFTPRYEYYSDRKGFITGVAQQLNSFTLTGEYKMAEGFLSRLEYRRDTSNKPFFDRGNENGSSKNQDTLLIGFVAFFGPKR